MRRAIVFMTVLISCLIAGGVSAHPNDKESQAQQQIVASLALKPNVGRDVLHEDTPPAKDQAPPVPPVDPKISALTEYFETAMNSWIKPTDLSADYHSVATDVATVVLSGDPIWDTDTTRARTGILLLSIAFWESRFFAYVDNLSCNKWARKLALAPKDVAGLIRGGDCDGGWAYSMWQIHPMRWYAGNGVIIDITSQQLADRRKAIAAALLIARRSIRGTKGLCWYTGEGADGTGCPKGVKRYEYGLRYYHNHPFAGFPTTGTP